MVLVADGERFRIIAAAAADFTHHVNVGQKIHFNAPEAIALAGFAAAAFHVEAEAAGFVTAFARFGKHSEKFADGAEDAGVGGWIRTRRAADSRLVYFNHFVYEFDAGDFAVRAKRFAG